MSATEGLLARHEAALESALREVHRLRDELAVSLTALESVAGVKAADLGDAPIKVSRLLTLQGIIIREDTAVRQLTARATNGGA
jgi:hypothetical protein